MSRISVGSDDFSGAVVSFTYWLFIIKQETLVAYLKEASESYRQKYKQLTNPLGEPAEVPDVNPQHWANLTLFNKGSYFFAKGANKVREFVGGVAVHLFENRLKMLEKHFPGGPTAVNVQAYIRHPAFRASEEDIAKMPQSERALVIDPAVYFDLGKVARVYTLKDHAFGLLFAKFLEDRFANKFAKLSTKLTRASCDKEDVHTKSIYRLFTGGQFDPYAKASEIYTKFLASYAMCSDFVKSNAEDFGLDAGPQASAANLFMSAEEDLGGQPQDQMGAAAAAVTSPRFGGRR